ncbi:MAG: hypothetical protein GF383_08375 [Candidatus Lokiarchaeota archaeon]|nr:hypothetical protein [Candidatus Lokiarchaeota archaeon]MBD3340369.1 hypothetical protein [Candidatus Lokiarchaeota archaeon]
MSLDRWIKTEESEEKEEKPIKKKIKKKPIENKNKQKRERKKEEKAPVLLTKYQLLCSKAKCKYQKTIMKKRLTSKDKTCPRCGSEMKVKKL